MTTGSSCTSLSFYSFTSKVRRVSHYISASLNLSHFHPIYTMCKMGL